MYVGMSVHEEECHGEQRRKGKQGRRRSCVSYVPTRTPQNTSCSEAHSYDTFGPNAPVSYYLFHFLLQRFAALNHFGTTVKFIKILSRLALYFPNHYHESFSRPEFHPPVKVSIMVSRS